MKLFILPLVLSLAFNINKANCQQDSIIPGAYRNSVDFANQKIMYENDFIFIKEFSRGIPELYKVKPKHRTIDVKDIKKAIFCIFDGNNFYLNIQRLGMTRGYINLGKPRRYSYFKGLPIMTLRQEENQMGATYNYGLMGLSMSTAIISLKNKNNIHYVFEIEKGMIDLLTKSYILRILETYPKLFMQFQQEEDNESIEVLIRYLDLVNRQDNS